MVYSMKKVQETWEIKLHLKYTLYSQIKKLAKIYCTKIIFSTFFFNYVKDNTQFYARTKKV